MKKFTNEIKIGIFVVLAILTGIFLWGKTADVSKESYDLKTYFSYAGGLKVNAIVTLSGIEVGRVKSIKFVYDPETKVEVVIAIEKIAKVHADSIAYICSTGFIGDVHLGLTPGSADQPFLKDGAAVASEDPIEARKMMKKADAIAMKLDETLNDVKQLSANLNLTVSENKESVDNIVKNLEQTSVNFNEFSEDIKDHPWKLLMKGKEKTKKR